MVKRFVRNREGITLVSLIITIIVLLIIASIIIYRISDFTSTSKFNKMKADIELLHDKILTYNQKYDELPIVGEVLGLEFVTDLIGTGENEGDQRGENDSNEYYRIDLTKLENITLNYGEGENDDDYYIVNERTLNVYYVKGIWLEGTLYHVGREYTGSLLPEEIIPSTFGTRITASTSRITNASTITYTIIFDEPIENFNLDGIRVEHGEIEQFREESKTKYTLVVTNDEDGSVDQKVIVGAEKYQNAKGDINEGTEITIKIDKGLPELVEDYQQASNDLTKVGVHLYTKDDNNGSGINKIEVKNQTGTLLTTITDMENSNYETSTSGTYTFVVYDKAGNTRSLDIPVNVTNYIPIYSQTHLANVGSINGTVIDIAEEKNQGARAGKKYNFLYTSNYKVMNNITLAGAWRPISLGTTAFSGRFDGQNYTISNLTINETNTISNLGYALFSVNKGTISNLKLSNVDISVSAGNYSTYLAGLVAYNYNQINNCVVESGTITGNTTSDSSSYNFYMGGIVRM